MSVNPSRAALIPIIDILATDIGHIESLIPKPYDSIPSDLRGGIPGGSKRAGFGCRGKGHSRQAEAHLLQTWLTASKLRRAGLNAWC